MGKKLGTRWNTSLPDKMKTVTYEEIVNRACEAAGRGRSKLPAAESSLLRSALAIDLRRVWNGVDWPELIPDPAETAVTDGEFSKAEGTDDELGDILGIYSANPRSTTIYDEVGWDEGDGVVRVHNADDGSGYSTVWVESMLPCPDLTVDAELGLSGGETVDDYEMPARFAAWLAERGAAHLLTADGATVLAGVHFGLAESYLNAELERITRPPWRDKLKFRR